MLDSILFPSSFFDHKRVDEDLQREYTAAVDCGLYRRMVIFSYEDWFHHGRLVLDQVPSAPVATAYRGYMMKPEQYARFYTALLGKNIRLVTAPEAYNALHLFPNVYPRIAPDTPATIVFPPGSDIDLAQVKKRFRRFMVKDYVKSVKGTDFPVYFDADIPQDQFDAWMEKFKDYRAPLFTGGFCVKEYVDLMQYGGHKNEYRVFYIAHQAATVSRNSGQGDFTPPPPKALIEKYRDLDSPFYTVDLAQLADGSWRILETGDGGVSGLSDFQDYNEFYRKLCYLL